MNKEAQMLLEEEINITHPDKIIWADPEINKVQFLSYLVAVAPVMLPFLRQRALTVIRFPHGAEGPSFFQKNCPDYAPDYVMTAVYRETRAILCNNLRTLIWLGNQLALEYHLPFSRVDSSGPVEIVFDLDPPDDSKFALAIKAAQEMKSIFDRLNIRSFPKLTGSRGLQIHIPLRPASLTYQETRLFTSFVASLLVDAYPDLFTTERLKRRRGGKLYIDYVQHAPGKTMICPYSSRGKAGGKVAAPLFWEEVNEQLQRNRYTIPEMLKRIKHKGNPMAGYFETDNQVLIHIVWKLKEKTFQNNFTH
ncbi:non-homologous end-joining DNA ligase [Sporolactobacillus sp. THM19-2]|uniref:non-homologous end-joining DNA ligase n=1 Tax=Sporolactobacillus sp. THM19-2 TaxID=2511171 RepID=UPI001F0F8AC1|nr:non-homologous end-joining DNA ligase [Sporolactobacillus sp. THM19-2]